MLNQYFDYGATAPLRSEVLEAMMPYFTDYFGNPNSLHQVGLIVKRELEAAREMIAKSIGATSREIIFTGSGTEANNIAVIGIARRLQKLGKGNHVITSSIEHASVLKACQSLEKDGFEVTFLPVNHYGQVDISEVKKAFRRDTILISVMHANNVIGTLQPIEEIGRLAKERGVIFHTDAIQSYGKIPVDVDRLGVDLLSMNAHKIGGPKGVAALYMRKGIRVEPLYYGGEQERGIRPATQNVAGIIGFAQAVELALTEQSREEERLMELRSYICQQLQHLITGVKINGHPTETLPNLLNISIEHIEGQGLMLELDRLGFATSSGSACSSTEHEPSYVLLATNPSRDHALESLRITMGRTTTRESVDAFIQALVLAAAHWRS